MLETSARLLRLLLQARRDWTGAGAALPPLLLDRRRPAGTLANRTAAGARRFDLQRTRSRAASGGAVSSALSCLAAA
jgi:hypothetical protein